MVMGLRVESYDHFYFIMNPLNRPKLSHPCIYQWVTSTTLSPSLKVDMVSDTAKAQVHDLLQLL